MKVYTTKFYTITILSLLAFVMTSSVCSAQEYSRKGRSEIFGMVQMVGGMDFKVDDIGYESDSTNIFGIGFGYNATDHWNVNMDLLFGSADAELVIPGYVVLPHSAEADYFLWDINVDYNFFADRLTPLVTAGIGLARIDTEVSFPQIEDTSDRQLSYNIGVGGRWDITDDILVKLIYRITWTQIKDIDDKSDFRGVCLSVAYMF